MMHRNQETARYYKQYGVHKIMGLSCLDAFVCPKCGVKGCHHIDKDDSDSNSIHYKCGYVYALPYAEPVHIVPPKVKTDAGEKPDTAICEICGETFNPRLRRGPLAKQCGKPECKIRMARNRDNNRYTIGRVA